MLALRGRCFGPLAMLDPDAGSSGSYGSGKGGYLLGVGGRTFTDIRGKALNQKRVVCMDEAYLTEQVLMQKKEREVREEKLTDEGFIKDEVKALMERKMFDRELHFDDCGSDLGPLEEKPFIHAFASIDALNPAIAYSCFACLLLLPVVFLGPNEHIWFNY